MQILHELKQPLPHQQSKLLVCIIILHSHFTRPFICLVKWLNFHCTSKLWREFCENRAFPFCWRRKNYVPPTTPQVDYTFIELFTCLTYLLFRPRLTLLKVSKRIEQRGKYVLWRLKSKEKARMTNKCRISRSVRVLCTVASSNAEARSTVKFGSCDRIRNFVVLA